MLLPPYSTIVSSLATPRDGQQRLELRLVDEVAAYLVLEVGGPVELDRALDVALVVGGGVLVDLDEDDLRVIEMVLHPLGGDECGVAAHGAYLSRAPGPGAGSGGGWLSGRWPAAGSVQLAPQAQPEDGVEQGRHEREPDGDQPHGGEAGEQRRRGPRPANPRPTAWAKRGGRGSSSPPGAPRRGRTSPRKTRAYGVCWTPRVEPTANTAACPTSRTTVTATGVTSASASTTDVSVAATRGPLGSMPAMTGELLVTVDMDFLTGDGRGRGGPSRQARGRAGRTSSAHQTERRAHAAVVDSASPRQKRRSHDRNCRQGTPVLTTGTPELRDTSPYRGHHARPPSSAAST